MSYGYPYPGYPAPFPAYPCYSGGIGPWYALFIVLLILVLIFWGWWYFSNQFC
ncbi:hypothetical protein RCG23_18670 [Neobacillus sp. PS3-34]|uniref:hypothetical protein n=1 Tax=Neobacillus sp. PS3-34 TaxID=3070678 RepID=UPI0027E0C828|nr:hypothetical protein [Neobacillus sp. PS3-34]WML47447.1 hypothetical protein RCG23_18670 [Neobacillus sp. PS3-34]